MNPSVTLDSVTVANSPIGLDQWAVSNLKAYPNPSRDWMQLESAGSGIWTVYTLLGYERHNNEMYQVSDPMCNALFVRQVVIPYCKPFMSRNLINSNLDEIRCEESRIDLNDT